MSAVERLEDFVAATPDAVVKIEYVGSHRIDSPRWTASAEPVPGDGSVERAYGVAPSLEECLDQLVQQVWP